MDIRYQVFVSSTYEDLRSERQQATQTIIEMGHLPAGMELFPATDLSQWELIKRVINESDYYLVIVGGKYGSVSPVTGLGYTEMEYDYAVSCGIPILGFVRKTLSEVKSAFVESDPQKRGRLETFRAKALSRHCILYDDPRDLGMLIMKSLVSETRINPRIGWIRADKARTADDLVREQELVDALRTSEREIKKLQRKLRDVALPVDGARRGEIAQGDDLFGLKVIFQDQDKKLVVEEVPISWDSLFSVIGPSMFGYIVRRARVSYNQEEKYPFESNLVDYVRILLIDRCGNRQIKILSHQIDTILLQFKQLGLVEFHEKEKDEDGRPFRGYTLTPHGEEYLTKIKVHS